MNGQTRAALRVFFSQALDLGSPTEIEEVFKECVDAYARAECGHEPVPVPDDPGEYFAGERTDDGLHMIYRLRSADLHPKHLSLIHI